MDTYEYTECYIAFLDMLGFKELVYKSLCNDIYEIFKTFNRKPISEAYRGNKNIISKNTTDALKMKVMSDSICLYIEKKIPDALLCILMSCMQMQFDLLKFTTPILLRGAIIRGKIYAEKDVTFGPGLTDAYLMEENNAKYPRIILTKEVLSDTYCVDSDKEHILYETIFRDFDAFYAVNYFSLVSTADKAIIKNILSTVNNILDTTTNNSIREKYLYFDRKLRERTKYLKEV